MLCLLHSHLLAKLQPQFFDKAYTIIYLYRLRAQLGVDKLKNIVHGSSNPDKAVEVIKEFFPEVELLPDGTVKRM